MKSIALLVLGLAISWGASGCGGAAPAREPSVEARREVAQRFAAAIVRGDAEGARALLVHPGDAALAEVVARAAAPWERQHGRLRLPGARLGTRWIFGYSGRHTERDGRFQTQTGDVVVVVAPSPRGAAVLFFTFQHVRTRFSTHHDSQLLPSKR